MSDPGVGPVGGSRSSADGRRWWIPAAALIALAFGMAARTTYDLEWPVGVDAFRDVAQAQTLVDTERLADPFYLGERAWYSPLGPVAVAILSVTSGLEVPAANARLGPYLNLITPIALFVLVQAWFGSRAGVVALALLLFTPSGPDHLEPTYSPWLFGHNFAPGLFLFALLTYGTLPASNTLRLWLKVVPLGLGMGLTVLAHGGPALVLAATIGLHAVVSAAAERPRRASAWRNLAAVATAGIVALLVASPFLAPIAERYRFVVLNIRPNVWLEPQLAVGSLSEFLAIMLTPWWRTVLAAAGIWALLRARATRGRGLLFLWCAVAGLLTIDAWLIARQGTPGAASPLLVPTVPTHHFLLSFRLGLTILAGCGAVALVDLALGRLLQAPRLVAWPGRARLPGVAIMVGVALLVAVTWPSYARQDMFGVFRDGAVRTYPGEWRTLRTWARSHTTAGDVFLAPNTVSLALVGVWGRKSVSVDPFFSNPFVDWGSRNQATEAMYESLVRQDCGSFRALAGRFHVTHVLDVERRSPSIEPGTCQLRVGGTAPETIVYCAHP